MKKMSAYVKNIILTHPVLSIIILLVIPIFVYLIALVIGLKSIFETDFKRHSEPRLPSTAQINH
ncbi:hypothetical protein ACE83Q_07680 (plasmid) [Dellaglioa sp. P0083]|uniref:hypothetical protein n=1 Tax=Dellaglioa kimchii TaxID=3344667 RepID=UPI0038D42C88